MAGFIALIITQETGLTSSQVMLLYLLFNLSAAALAIPADNLSDKYWRSRVLVPGYLIYGIVYFGFAFMHSKPATVILFIAYEAYTAFISGAERAFIIENSPAEFQGTMLGIYGMLQGIGLLLASIIAGMMWNGFGSDAPFVFGGILGTVSSALIAFILGDKNKRKYSQQYE